MIHPVVNHEVVQFICNLAYTFIPHCYDSELRVRINHIHMKHVDPVLKMNHSHGWIMMNYDKVICIPIFDLGSFKIRELVISYKYLIRSHCSVGSRINLYLQSAIKRWIWSRFSHNLIWNHKECCMISLQELPQISSVRCNLPAQCCVHIISEHWTCSMSNFIYSKSN